MPDVGPVEPAQCETIGEQRCAGNRLEVCDANWQWQVDASCPFCLDGACLTAPGPRCVGLPATCGPNGDEDCCATLPVPGGEFDRYGDPSFHVTLTSDFALDRFEVTVGRFRGFVASYTGEPPEEGAGAHPRVPGSGWNPAWNDDLPEDAAELKKSLLCGQVNAGLWTDEPGENEDKPINCVRWVVAFAFCAWDGGYLPTEAEWLRAAGGTAQSVYPWGGEDLPPDDRAVFGCRGDGSPAPDCSDDDIPRVGSFSPIGDGEWGHADLVGSMNEWALDARGDLPAECTDCANVDATAPIYRIRSGGHWRAGAGELKLDPGNRVGVLQSYQYDDLGIRCARELP